MAGLSTFWSRFLSTPSARRATVCLGEVVAAIVISIHALREEGDAGRSSGATTTPIFLSTPSARRATCAVAAVYRTLYISIHALREEGDALCGIFLVPFCAISIHALREEGDPRAGVR